MAGTDTLRKKIELLIQVKGRQKVAQDLALFKRDLSKSFAGISGGQKGFAGVKGKDLSLLNKNAKQLGLNMNAAALKTRKFKMEYLGLMFAGMALQKVTLGFLRSAITSYNKAFEEQSKFEKATGKLTAAWTFFKFQLIDTLANSKLFGAMIDMLSRFVDWLSNLSDSGIMAIVGAIGGAAIGGTLLFALSQIVLAVDSAKMAFPGLKTTGKNAIGAIQKIAAAGIGIWMFLKGFEEFDEGKAWSSLSSMLAGSAFFAVATGKTKAAGALIAISAGVELLSVITGESDLMSSLEDIGMSLALMGAVSGNPWIVAIGVVLKFLEPIGQFLDNMFKKIEEKLQSSVIGRFLLSIIKGSEALQGMQLPTGGLNLPEKITTGKGSPFLESTGALIDDKTPGNLDALKQGMISLSNEGVANLHAKLAALNTPINNLKDVSLPAYGEELNANKEAQISAAKATQMNATANYNLNHGYNGGTEPKFPLTFT